MKRKMPQKFLFETWYGRDLRKKCDQKWETKTTYIQQTVHRGQVQGYFPIRFYMNISLELSFSI